MRYTPIAILLTLTACYAVTEPVDGEEPQTGDERPYDPEPEPEPTVPASTDAGVVARDSSAAEPAGDAAVHAQPAPTHQDASLRPAADAGTAPDASAAATDAAPVNAPPVAPDSSPPPCTPMTWYRDADSDGFGDPTAQVASCSAPAGYVAGGEDCYDSSADAHPGQTKRFAAHRGDSSYDYDCDGDESPLYPDVATCPELDDSCPPPNRWPAGFSCDYLAMTAGVNDLVRYGWTRLSPTIPECGVTAPWGYTLTWEPSEGYQCHTPADLPAGRRTQSCR